jgi:cytochrome P450
VTRDIELDGHLLKAGDLALFPLVAANRDEALLADGDHVSFDRGQMAPHLAFGAGPHRCIGSHLARIEINVALAEWHKAFGSYGVKPDVPVRAYWGNVHGMFNLPLVMGGDV